VTTHVKRLCALLDQEGVPYVVYNTGSDFEDGQRIVSIYKRRLRWLLGYFFFGREPAVFLMPQHLSIWNAGGLLGRLRKKRVLLMLHNSRLCDWQRKEPLRHRLAGFALRGMSGVISVNRALEATVRDHGVAASASLYCPAFLPPSTDDRARESVDSCVWRFAEAHAPLISANGRVGWYEGVDLYGLDMLVELTARLVRDYPRLGIAVCFWNHSEKEQPYLDRLIQRAEELGVADNILFNTKPGFFVPVIEASTVFVRPTNTDGDAGSIREALYLGVPAVVSDAVERPAGTFLFQSRDIDDFEAKTREALSHADAAQRAERLPSEDEQRIRDYITFLKEMAGFDAEQHPLT